MIMRENQAYDIFEISYRLVINCSPEMKWSFIFPYITWCGYEYFACYVKRLTIVAPGIQHLGALW